jgi:hypothetical protein
MRLGLTEAFARKMGDLLGAHGLAQDFKCAVRANPSVAAIGVEFDQAPTLDAYTP